MSRERRQVKSMTVGQLIGRLRNFPEDQPVVFSYDYGDHWHTNVADVIGDLEDREVEWSDYHSTFKITEDEDEDDDGDHGDAEGKGEKVVVISGRRGRGR